jgi:hypothetical protein
LVDDKNNNQTQGSVTFSQNIYRKNMTNPIEFSEKKFSKPPAIKAIGALVVALIAMS